MAMTDVNSIIRNGYAYTAYNEHGIPQTATAAAAAMTHAAYDSGYIALANTNRIPHLGTVIRTLILGPVTCTGAGTTGTSIQFTYSFSEDSTTQVGETHTSLVLPLTFASTALVAVPNNTALTVASTLPATPLTVASTSGYPTAGILAVGDVPPTGTASLVTYTGTTGTTFTGCTNGVGLYPVGTPIRLWSTLQQNGRYYFRLPETRHKYLRVQAATTLGGSITAVSYGPVHIDLCKQVTSEFYQCIN